MIFVLTTTSVESYERRTHADARAAEVPGAVVVARQEDLKALDGKLLVTLYNLAANEPESHAKPVARFSDSDAAARRVWPVIEYLGKPGPVPAVIRSTTSSEDSTMARSKSKKSKTTTPGAGRPSAFSGKTIHKLAKENPRRAGTHGFKAWEKLKSGMTYEAYIAAGGARNHLAWDLAHKFVELRNPAK